MKAAKRWSKIKTVAKLVQNGEQEEESEEEEKNVYEIEPEPEPKFKYRIFRNRELFMRPIKFEDKEAESTTDVLPDKKLRSRYLIKQPYEKVSGKNVIFSHSDCNTVATEMVSSTMNHTEGGWPKDVKTEQVEQKNKFIRKTCKEDMFKYTTTKLGQTMAKALKQNITLNLEETYFDDIEESPSANSKKVTIIGKLKDFSGRRRPVSCLAWQRVKSDACVAISHCSSEFLGSHEETCTDAYLCNFERSTVPKCIFTAPDHLTILDYNEKQKNLLSGGCYNGQVTHLCLI